jgi:hypothetical protein
LPLLFLAIAEAIAAVSAGICARLGFLVPIAEAIAVLPAMPSATVESTAAYSLTYA